MSSNIDVWFLNNLRVGFPREVKHVGASALCCGFHRRLNSLYCSYVVLIELHVRSPLLPPVTSDLTWVRFNVRQCTCPGKVQTNGAGPDGLLRNSKPSRLLRI